MANVSVFQKDPDTDLIFNASASIIRTARRASVSETPTAFVG